MLDQTQVYRFARAPEERKMKETQTIQEILAERLRTIDPKMVVLFGSHAHGTPGQDSDFDVYVVTKDQFIPKNYQEKGN